jgi:hypothetical protein
VKLKRNYFYKRLKKQKKNKIKLKIISNLGWNNEIENKYNFYKRA